MASTSDLKSFIGRQRVLLQREKDAELERTSLLLSNCSRQLLEQKGLALGGLGVASVQIGLGGKSLIELERPSAYHSTIIFPPHTLRPGDLARIEEHISPVSSSGKKSSTKTATATKEDRRELDGVVYKVLDTKIVLAIDPSSNDDPQIPERCWLLKLANTVTYDRMDKAMDQLERLVLPDEATSAASGSVPRGSPAGPNALHRVLLGISTPTNLLPASQATPSSFFDPSLNPSQVAAVRFALHAPEVACIHGPPGTGKTRVLVEVIRQLVFESSLSNGADKSDQPNQAKPIRILVCGASNLAVDNLLERLSLPTPSPGSVHESNDLSNTNNVSPTPRLQQQFPPIALTRLGHPARVLSSLHSRTLDAQAQASDEAALVTDIKEELEGLMNALNGSASRHSSSTGMKGGRGAKTGSSNSRGGASGSSNLKKGQRLRGEERKKAWQNVRDLRKEYRKREGGVVKSVLSKAQVVLATCHGAGSRQLYIYDFDVVIIDEATQALEAVCWVPVLKARKLILAGDPMQLGPTIISEGARHPKVQKGKGTASNQKGQEAQLGQADPDDKSSQSVDGGASDSETSASSSSPGESKGEAVSVVNQVKKAVKSSPRSPLHPPKSLGTTLFDRLETMYHGKVKRMLDVQYRMNTKISTFPSQTLYHSRLRSHPSNASRLLRDLPGVSQDAEYEDVVGEGSEVIFWDTAGAEFWERSGNDRDGVQKVLLDDGGSLCNENEAAVVKRWVDRLMDAGVKASDIAIITPYQAQSQVLSAMLTDPGLEIGTADGMQGREREAVVVSLVRSNPEGEVGFLKEKRRLNVAMTRAKRQLCVVGDSSTISRGGGKYLKKWMAWLEVEADVRFAGDE